jgi:hypothetical protein
MLVSSFVGRTFFSFGCRMIVCETVYDRERNRRNPVLLSSNSILAAVTTSLFSSISSFSSLVLFYYYYHPHCPRHWIDVSANDFSLLLYDDSDDDDNNKQFSSEYSSTLRILERNTRQRRRREKNSLLFSINKHLLIHKSTEIWCRSLSSHSPILCKYHWTASAHVIAVF